jgi:protein-disulfide isomerase
VKPHHNWFVACMSERAALWTAVLVGVILGIAMITTSLLGVRSLPGGAGWQLEAGIPSGPATIGRPDTKVKVVVYQDFQCGHCAELYRGAETEIIRRYVLSGQLHLEIKSLPFLGPDSMMAAEASLCAGDQGRYWDYYDALIATYTQQGRLAYSESGLQQTASSIGLDAEQIRRCIASGRHRARIQHNAEIADQLGIQVIPVVSINNQLVVGSQPFSVYDRIIQEELSR